MIKIEITSPAVKELKGIGRESGKPYHIRMQSAYAFQVDKDTGEVAKYPEKFEFFLDDAHQGYAAGVYQLLPSSVYVSHEGRLAIVPRLAPVTAPKA